MLFVFFPVIIDQQHEGLNLISTGCYGIDNFFKFKAENQFDRRHTYSILRIKFIFPTKKLGKLAFCNSLSKDILDDYFIYKGVLSMPIFEYTCKKCGKEFERVVFSGDEKDITCPECKSKDVKKNMSASTFMGAGIGSCATSFPKGPS